MTTKLNAFIDDAQFEIKKAGEIISNRGSDASLRDGILFYAIGVEKLLKGVLHDISPVLVYEKPAFEDVCLVLFGDRLTKSKREKFEEKERAKFHAGVATINTAAAFSETVGASQGMLVQLFDYRATIVHKPMQDFPYKDAWQFMIKNCYDFVARLVAEFPAGKAGDYFNGLQGEILRKEGKELLRRDNLKARASKLITAHTRAYAKIKDNTEKLRAARQEAQKAVQKYKGDIVQRSLMECPICHDIAYAEYINEPTPGTNSGTLEIFGMKCFCCGLEIDNDYELIDYFRLYDELFGKGY